MRQNALERAVFSRACLHQSGTRKSLKTSHPKMGKEWLVIVNQDNDESISTLTINAWPNQSMPASASIRRVYPKRIISRFE